MAYLPKLNPTVGRGLGGLPERLATSVASATSAQSFTPDSVFTLDDSLITTSTATQVGTFANASWNGRNAVRVSPDKTKILAFFQSNQSGVYKDYFQIWDYDGSLSYSNVYSRNRVDHRHTTGTFYNGFYYWFEQDFILYRLDLSNASVSLVGTIPNSGTFTDGNSYAGGLYKPEETGMRFLIKDGKGIISVPFQGASIGDRYYACLIEFSLTDASIIRSARISNLKLDNLWNWSTFKSTRVINYSENEINIFIGGRTAKDSSAEFIQYAARVNIDDLSVVVESIIEMGSDVSIVGPSNDFISEYGNVVVGDGRYNASGGVVIGATILNKDDTSISGTWAQQSTGSAELTGGLVVDDSELGIYTILQNNLSNNLSSDAFQRALKLHSNVLAWKISEVPYYDQPDKIYPILKPLISMVALKSDVITTWGGLYTEGYGCHLGGGKHLILYGDTNTGQSEYRRLYMGIVE